MKKITILFPTLFMGIAMFGQTGVNKKQTTGNQGSVAQHISANIIKPTHKSKYEVGDQSQIATITKKGKAVTVAPFWTNDFSVPANWNLTNHLGTNAWSIGTTPPGGPPY